MLNDRDIAQRMQQCQEITVEAGALAVSIRLGGVNAHQKSHEFDLVTDGDEAVEDLIFTRLRELYKDDGFQGEESGYRPGQNGFTWILDPVDGTANYYYGLPEYAVSLALVSGPLHESRWTQHLGVVYNPVTHELFSAVQGEGAFLNGRSITASSIQRLENAMVGTGFSYTTERRITQCSDLSHLIGSIRDVRCLGSAAISICAVAGGHLDAYFQSGLKIWDHAAAGLIAREAGAKVGRVRDAYESSDAFLVAPGSIYDQLSHEISGMDSYCSNE